MKILNNWGKAWKQARNEIKRNGLRRYLSDYIFIYIYIIRNFGDQYIVSFLTPDRGIYACPFKIYNNDGHPKV